MLSAKRTSNSYVQQKKQLKPAAHDDCFPGLRSETSPECAEYHSIFIVY